MGGTLNVSLHLDDLSDGSDAVDDGTLIEFLRANRKKLEVQLIEDDPAEDT